VETDNQHALKCSIGGCFFLEPLCAPGLDPLFWVPARLGLVSAWWGHVPFAQWLVAAARPKNVVELGTHHGVSYCAFCEAVLRAGLDCQCSAVDTWQGDPQTGFYSSDVYRELAAFHAPRYGSFSNLIRTAFDSALEYFTDGTVDLLHIDGLHSYEAVKHDFFNWKPKLSARAVVLLHDTEVKSGDFGVWRLWDELKSHYPHFSFIHSHGLGVLAVGDDAPEVVKALCSVDDEGKSNLIRERFARAGERWELDLAKITAETARGQLERALWEQVNRGDLLTEHNQELSTAGESLRAHVADLEKARSTLEGALGEQLNRGDLLTEQNQELSTAVESLRAHVSDLKNVRSILESAMQEEIKQSDMLREQNEGLSKWADEVQKSKDDTLDKLDLVTEDLAKVTTENATFREKLERLRKR